MFSLSPFLFLQPKHPPPPPPPPPLLRDWVKTLQSGPADDLTRETEGSIGNEWSPTWGSSLFN